MSYDDKAHALDPARVDEVAARLTLRCLPGNTTPEWEKDRIYWAALQLAWLTHKDPLGAEMLSELKALRRRGKHELEMEAAAAIIKKYHALHFQEAHRG